MNKSMTSKIWAAAIVTTLALAVFAAVPANASLVLTLKWDSDQTTGAKTVTSANNGTTYTVDVYATITTPGGDPLNMGIQYAYYKIVGSRDSGQSVGEADMVRYSGSSDTTNQSFLSTGSTGVPAMNANGAQKGVLGDLNSDSMIDLGSSVSDVLGDQTGYVKPRNASEVVGDVDGDGTIDPSAGGGDVGAAITNGWEVLIGKFRVKLVTVPTAGHSLTITASPPAWVPSESLAGANWWQDDGSGGSAFESGAYTGTSLQFTVAGVPEPATMAILAIGGLSMAGSGLVRRFRSRKA